MTTQNTASATNAMKSDADDLQSLFNKEGGKDVLKALARMSERMTAIMVEAGTPSTDIMSRSTEEALSNLREATQACEESEDYSKAYSALAQKQMELLTRTTHEIGEVAQKAGDETTELTSKTGEELSDKVAEKFEAAAATTKDAVDKAGSSAKKAA